MLDVGWSEMLVIAIVVIVVVGPKDLPKLLRQFGRTTAKMRAMAGDFRRQFDEALKEAELDEVKNLANEARKFDPRTTIKKHLNPIEKAGQELRAGMDAAMKPKPDTSATPASAVPQASEPVKLAATQAAPAAAAPASAGGEAAKPAKSKPRTKAAAAPAKAEGRAAARKPAVPSKRAAAKPAAAKPAAAAAKPAVAAKATAKSAATMSTSAKPTSVKSASASKPVSRRKKTDSRT